MTVLGSRRTAVALVAVALLLGLVALPARAASTGHSTTVSLSPSTGSRQFFVEDLGGHDLTSLAFGSGGTLPFRVRVVDQAYAIPTEQFTVSATVNNLYLRTAPSTYSYPTMVPSSDVSVGFGGSPLNNFGLSFADLPTFTLAGTIPTCATLQAAQPATLAGLTTDLAAAPLCALLGATGTTVSGVSVAGLERTITPALSLLDVPVQLATGANTGPFTNADFSAGTIGAGDAARSSGAPAATARTLMTGAPGATANLLNQITTQLQTIVGSLPVTSPVDDPAGAQATMAATLTALQSSANSTIAQLGADLAALGDATKQSAIVNFLSGTLAAPLATDILNLTGTYAAFPVLTANAANAAAGTYEGTMTVTFVQT